MTDILGDDAPDGRLAFMYVGIVVDNIDPVKAGRVRVRIPGLIEPESGWALPMGTGIGGQEKRGTFFVPNIGAEVCVFFNQGDVDHPHYMGGHWGWDVEGVEGRNEVPTPVLSVPPEDAAKVRVIETDKFIIYMDDRPGEEDDSQAGKERLVIQYKDDPENFIEIDGLNRGVTISATAGINIVSTGLINITGLQVQINGRRIGDSTLKDI